MQFKCNLKQAPVTCRFASCILSTTGKEASQESNKSGTVVVFVQNIVLSGASASDVEVNMHRRA